MMEDIAKLSAKEKLSKLTIGSRVLYLEDGVVSEGVVAGFRTHIATYVTYALIRRPEEDSDLNVNLSKVIACSSHAAHAGTAL